jgi:hypothetical protein
MIVGQSNEDSVLYPWFISLYGLLYSFGEYHCIGSKVYTFRIGVNGQSTFPSCDASKATIGSFHAYGVLKILSSLQFLSTLKARSTFI